MCPGCLAAEPPFKRSRAVFLYEGVIPALLLRLKHGGATELAVPMGSIMAALGFQEGMSDAQVVVPVPSLPRRHLERGYNPAALLASRVGRCLGLPVRHDALERVGDTVAREHLDRRTRLTRVQEAYRPANTRHVQGRNVILVDDVITTGATAEACSRALMASGAAGVYVLAFAQAIPHLR